MAKNEPIKIDPFNPLDKTRLGISVAEAVLQQKIQRLRPEPFIGAGVYAIYYKGDFPTYRSIADRNKKGKYEQPIYVGKAVPAGSRKGDFELDADPGQVLYKRLAEHAASIEQVSNLHIEDFRCRYLVVDDIWIPLAESLLIQKFRPLWNHRIDGFGIHDPGSGRHKQRRSQWDTIHPGRPWADKLAPPSMDEREIRERAESYLSKQELLPDIDDRSKF